MADDKMFFGDHELGKEEDEHDFESGASSSGHKPPYECLTLTLLTRAAKRMELGMHYGKHNWKKGIRDKQFILDRLNHALEHLVKAAANIDNNWDSSDDDLAAVVVNCMFAMEYQSAMLFFKPKGEEDAKTS